MPAEAVKPTGNKDPESSDERSQSDDGVKDTGLADGALDGKDVPTLIRFRRPVLTDSYGPEMTESYETLTLTELQQIDRTSDSDYQAQLDELQLALGDFEEGDEFEEVDEFEDDWEEGMGVEGDWDVEPEAYCGGDDYEDEYLDDRD